MTAQLLLGDRYGAWVRSGWKALSPEPLKFFCDHIRRNDLVETASELRAMAAASGFNRCEVKVRVASHVVLGARQLADTKRV
jgi:hypothetical protein